MTLNILKTTVAVMALTTGAAFAASDTTSSTDDSTQEIIQNTADDAAEATENVVEETAEATENAAEAVEETAENAAEATGEAMQETADAIDDATDMQSDDATASTEMADARPFDGMYVGDLIGLNVYGAQGEDVGEVDYIVRQGDELAAVIGVGGFLGLGEYTVAIPLDQFVPAEGDLEGIQLTSWTEEELKAQPEFDESSVEPLADDTIIADGV